MENNSRIKAQTFASLLQSAPIEIKPNRIFQQGLTIRSVLEKQRHTWWTQQIASFHELQEEINLARECGAFSAIPDFSHTTSNTKTLLTLGFRGVAQQVKPGTELRESADICFHAMADYCLRLSKQKGVSKENVEALKQLAVGAPRNLYEALVLLSLYFFLHEFIGGTRVRTLGRLDEILLPFYAIDRAQGKSKDQIRDLLRLFLLNLWEMKVRYDVPFCIGGTAQDGTETTNELSYLIVEAYQQCRIYSPKIHVRVSDQTPEDFIKLVLSCIRDGNSSFVFINDGVGIPMMQRCGATLEEARSYVLIGCYEPAIFDKELPCTGNSYVNLPKAVELVFTNGRDHATGKQIGVATGEIHTYDEFYAALKMQIAHFIERSMVYVREVEKHYYTVNPDPILSALLSPCAQSGVDAYAYGAKYNNSSIQLCSIGSLADAVYAVKWLVEEQKRLTFDQLRNILLADWCGFEDLRLEMRHLPQKYGNNVDEVDNIAADICAYCAGLINGKPNARGGIFKAANFSIDRCFSFGNQTLATPDGRRSGEPLSKNLGAVPGMDRKGLTAMIQSAVKTNPSLFPDGSVLDFVLHPSAVAGENGLNAFLTLLKVYFAKGGFAMHGNVFCAEDLKAAQADPEKYANLQVRVCGWNAFFVNLTKEEQDAFITQAERAV